jgi:trehalose/maltose hydrolase-like predicted phosphorylase
VLSLSLLYREHPLVVRISGSGVEVIAETGMRRPIEVACRDQVATLKPGSTVRFVD